MIPRKRTIAKIDLFFVNRKTEMACFKRITDPNSVSNPVYYIIGENAIGKSWLLYKFYMECKKKGWFVVLIDFSKGSGSFTDYLSILKEIQASLQQPFKRYQDRTKKALSIPDIKVQTGDGEAGRGVEIADGAKLENVKINGQIAAGNINNFYIQIKDRKNLMEIDIIQQLTTAFLEDLIEYVGNQPIIFLFDDIGIDMSGKSLLDNQTRRWLIEDFILQLCEKLDTVRFVITQKGELEPSLQTFLSDYYEKQELKDFNGNKDNLYEIYRTYLSKHGFIKEDIPDWALHLYHDRVQGKPSQLLTGVQIMKGG